MPYAEGNVGLSLVPELGALSAEIVRTNAVGRASVIYTAPELAELNGHSEVEIEAVADGVVERAALQFAPPDLDAVAEPRFHTFGWDAEHALLPPDPGIEARLEGRLTLDGDPVAGYVVTLTLETADGVFDGALVDAGNAEGPVTDHEVVVRTDAAGALWVAYRPNAQGSRAGTVKDEVRLHSASFPYIGAWLVETGMDLELVEVVAPNLATGNAIMGQIEPLLLFVRDALHPNFPLSRYNNTDAAILDPETDAFMGVTVDISYPAKPAELLDLLQLVHLQVPRHQRLQAYFYEAGDGARTYLRTTKTNSNLPEIMPWMDAYNVYWVGVHFTPVGESRFVRESFNLNAGTVYDLENNYRLLGMVVDPELTSAVEIFFRDNPCGTGTQWGQQMKCGLALINFVPVLNQLSGSAAIALNLCETFFNILRGQYVDAATGANGLAYAALGDYVAAHQKELLLYGELGLTGYRSLTAVANVAGLFDCYWAVKRSGSSASLQACMVGSTIAAAGPAPEQELGLFVASALAQLDSPLDAVIVGGSGTTELLIGGTTPVVTASGTLTTTDLTHFSLVNDRLSVYLVPAGAYILHGETVTDTVVIVARRGEGGTGFELLQWEDRGTVSRTLSVSWDPASAGDLLVDEGGNGSVERTIAVDTIPYIAPPTGVAATVDEAGTLVVSWDAVAGAGRYQISYGTESRYAPQFAGYDQTVSTTATSRQISGLPAAGVTHYVTVSAVEAAGHQSLYSQEVRVAERGRMVPAVYLPLVVRGD
jgi:hypothetical protein